MQSLMARLRRFAAFSSGLFRPLRLGVRGIVIDGQGRVLLVRHTYVSGWYLPGGGVEIGESASEALGRELLEETGVEVLGTPVLHGIFFNPKVSRRDHVACYVVRDFRAHPFKPDYEIAEARFFALDGLPETTSPGTCARLAEIGGAPVSATW